MIFYIAVILVLKKLLSDRVLKTLIRCGILVCGGLVSDGLDDL